VRARIEALLRRANLRPGMGKLRAGELTIDPALARGALVALECGQPCGDASAGAIEQRA
jgi:hypothetical protein